MYDQDYFLSEVTKYLTFMADLEPRFGASAALLRFGRSFDAEAESPVEISRGTPNECFTNAARALIHRMGSGVDDLYYAEGYAIDRVGIPVPIQHAWLVDANGIVVDPTWPDSVDHFYFGVPFKTAFVLKMLDQTSGECGLLVKPSLMRKNFGSPDMFEAIVERSTNHSNTALTGAK